jgi:hypothetical protein
MASEHAPEVSRRRLLNFIIIAVAALTVGAASFGASVIYANVTAGRLATQARVQDKTIARLNATIAQQRRQLLASCNAAADLGTVPLPAKPPPSRFAVKIVTDNRAAWYGNGCPGSLPVPPGLAVAAARWHVPVNGNAP